MFEACESVIVTLASRFGKWRAGNSQRRIFLEFGHEELEIIGYERQVCIEVAKNIVIDAIETPEAGVETLDLGGKIVLTMWGHPNEMNPRVILKIGSDYFVGTVS